MDNDTRAREIAREAAALTERLADMDYTPAECERIARLLVDMDVDRPTDGLSPEQVILRELLLLQYDQDAVGGEDAPRRYFLGLETATLLARIMPTLRWDRLDVGPAMMANLIGITRNAIWLNIPNGNVPPKAVMMSGDRQDQIVYSLARALHTRAFQRRHKPAGRSKRYPPPLYNAARWVLERRARTPATAVVAPPGE